MSLRASRLVLEIIGSGNTVRLNATRTAIEILGNGTYSGLQATQVQCEILGEQNVPTIFVTALGSEILGNGTYSGLQATQVQCEILGDPMTARVTQQIVEVLGTGDGVARVTRQLVEVLGTGDGKARVTQQIVEVLGAIAWAASATSTLTLIQEALAVKFVYASASSVLVFSQTAENNYYYDTAESVLALSDVATYVRHVFASVSNVLTFVQSYDLQGPTYITIHHSLGLVQQADEHISVVNISIEHILDLEQELSRTIPVSASSVLALTDEGVRRSLGTSVLALTHSATVAKGVSVESTLALAQETNLDGVFNRSIEHALGLVQSGTYHISVSLCSYSPFVGFGGTGPDVTPPSLGTATLTLTYPYTAPTTTLVLRNPEFSNKDSLNFNRINRQTRGGTLIVFADEDWPKIQTLQIEVRTLKAQQAVDLLDFFGESLGKEVGLLDHENRQWRGIITEPSSPVSNPGRNDMSVSFMFEGELV